MSLDSVVPWRMRPDLVVVQTGTGHGETWTVKDPLRLKYFHLRPEEMTLLRLLNGNTSWQQTLSRLQAAFPDVRFSLENLHSFLISLIRSGLLVSTVAGQAQVLLDQQQRQRSVVRWQRLAAVLSHRFRGLDPTSILNRLDRLLGWIYQPVVQLMLWLLIAAAVFVAVTQADQIHRRLPELTTLATVDNLTLLFLAVVLIKVIHELGHGLTCVHYGGECHELGVLLVGFVPMLYCDVSDTWLQRSRWKRIQVSAAGLFVELVIAAVCFLLWRFSRPGPVNLFLLNITLVASVNTVLINGNPLLRYDGYHVLTDLLRMPNLGPEARRLTGSWFDRVVLGIALPADAVGLSPSRFGLVLYGAASSVYRLFVLSMIVWAIYQFLKPHGLQAVVWVLLIPLATGMVFSAAVAVIRRVRHVQRVGTAAATRRAWIGSAGLAVAVVLLVAVPLPFSVSAPFTVQPGGVPLYVVVPGTLDSAVPRNSAVTAGQVIARLSNPELQRQVAELESEVRERELHRSALLGLRSSWPAAAAALPAAEEAVRTAQERFLTLQAAAQQLQLVSPVDGRIVSHRNRLEDPETEASQQFWSGHALDPVNQGAWLERETLLGWVTQGAGWRADAHVRQEDIALVNQNAEVSLRFLSRPQDTVTARVRSVGNVPAAEVQRELVLNQLLLDSGRDYRSTAAGVRYPVRIAGSDPLPAPLYSSGIARISCQPRSLGWRLWRELSHAFAFRL